jgi:hypothetical protein
MTKEFEKRLAEDTGVVIIDNGKDHTETEFSYILFLCEKGIPIGFGALDSFLSGPDLERRVKLVEEAAWQNENLRNELADTLSLDQSNDWTEEYHALLCNVAGVNATFGKQK